MCSSLAAFVAPVPFQTVIRHLVTSVPLPFRSFLCTFFFFYYQHFAVIMLILIVSQLDVISLSFCIILLIDTFTVNDICRECCEPKFRVHI